jgi:serine/threonine-protein kinase HipA
MEDFCQLSGRPTDQKYRGSLEKAAQVIRRYASNSLFDLLGFFEINVFSFLTGNADMHLKNFSLLHNRNGMISLAPAYDLVSTRLLIPESADPEEFALPMNGKKRNFTLKDFQHFGTAIGLSAKQMDNSFKKFQTALGKTAALIEASFLPAPLQNRYRALINQRAARLGL